MILTASVHLNQTGTWYLKNLQIVPECEITKFSISCKIQRSGASLLEIF